MNLLCPNCQKMLTVPEQYAGQLMKCPQCSSTFTVPGLPPVPGAGPEPASFTSASAPPGVSPPPPPDVYGMRNEPEPMLPPPMLGPLTEPSSTPAAGSPGSFTPGAPPLPPGVPSSFKEGPPTNAPSGPPPGYSQVISIPFRDQVLQWVSPVAAMVLIFILQFFSWVGLYAGRVPEVTQSAWGIAFNSSEADPFIGPVALIKPRSEDKKKDAKEDDPKLKAAQALENPGKSGLMIVYLLATLVTLVVTVLCVAWPFLEGKVQLPPKAQQFLQQAMPFRWALVLGLHTFLLFFVVVFLFKSFPLELMVQEQAEKAFPVTADMRPGDQRAALASQGRFTDEAKRTLAFDVVVILHVLATASTGLIFWLQKRGPQYPPPKLEFAW